MSSSTLSALQADLLAAFFRREARFRLTGGAALAGFHLGHRWTEDLDLFAGEAVLDDGDRALTDAARELGADLEKLQTSESFRRRLVRRGHEAVVVDLAHDSAPRPQGADVVIGGIRVDTREEILANKLCALLSRSELRDLVDVRALEHAGLRVEDALAAAHQKDGGLTPAQLAWVLSQWTIGDDARIPDGTRPEALRDWLVELRARLARISWPGG